MNNYLNVKINFNLLTGFLFSIVLLISCGGGGGGGGGSSSPSDPGTPAFSVSTIDSTGDVGWFTSIATGSVHISYYDWTNSTLKYATNSSGTWNIDSSIDLSGNDVGQYSSIALDSFGNVHISYYDANTQSLKYASNSSGIWATGIIDNSGDVGEYSSVSADSSDNLHISYAAYDDINFVYYLKYATCSSIQDCTQAANWNTLTVDSSGDVGEYSSIAVDSSNSVHISYAEYDPINIIYSLKYATCSSMQDCTQAANWNTDTVDNSGDVGEHCSIAVSSNGIVHISYYDNSSGNLKYATNPSGSWNVETPDVSTDAGDYSSIALDSNNKVHISYYDWYSEKLKYATNALGSWAITTVDGTNSIDDDVGMYSSIAVDTTDNSVHISYYDFDNGNLKYAVK